MKFIGKVLSIACALIVVTYIVPGISTSGLYSTLVAALFIGLLNAILRPILILLTLPITILTLGLFIFVINAALFFFVATFVDGFHVESYLSALVGSILVSIVSGIIQKIS